MKDGQWIEEWLLQRFLITRWKLKKRGARKIFKSEDVGEKRKNSVN